MSRTTASAAKHSSLQRLIPIGMNGCTIRRRKRRARLPENHRRGSAILDKLHNSILRIIRLTSIKTVHSPLATVFVLSVTGGAAEVVSIPRLISTAIASSIKQTLCSQMWFAVLVPLILHLHFVEVCTCLNPWVEGCDVTPGNADGNTVINVSDAVYIIGYIFAGGPAPTPYAVASGDANGDCTVSISDAVSLINYIFAGGAAPIGCTLWPAACGTLR